MKQHKQLCRGTAMVTAALLTVGCLPFAAVPAMAADTNTWTGYALRGEDGQYLSVFSGGNEGEGIPVGFYDADGTASYNTWYFTETDLGITIKSALDEGQYYLAEDGNGGLCISTTPGIFHLAEDGTLSAFRSGVENPVYATVTPQAVTNLLPGDVNQDGVLNGEDLTLLRQTAIYGGDFVQCAMADVNGNGTVNGADVAALQQFLLGEDVSFTPVQIPACTIIPPADTVPVLPPVTTEPRVTTTTTAEITTTTTTTAVGGDGKYWLLSTDGASSVTIQAQGLPYAALSGGYGYWDQNGSQWISGNWSILDASGNQTSLDENGTATFTIDIPADQKTEQIQIQVYYYAQWDNDAGDMVDRDSSNMVFSIVKGGQSAVTTGTTASTTVSAKTTTTTTTKPAQLLSIDDLPADYQYAADWIWNNRISAEKSTERRNTIFDQIVAGKGTLNYVIRWQSYKTVTYEQRKQFEQLVSDSINDWTDWLVGYENWPYDHVEVNVVGWAVIDKSCLLDLHDDEVVYTDTIPYDSQYDTSNGYETIPDVLPCAPDALSRMEHWADTSYVYPGGLDKRFDMYLWATQGFPAIGGCGGDWGQRLSDDAYLNMLDGTGLHVLEHELGHGFGMTDFYGGEGASDGFPPGGFPGGENSLMMAGSATKITDFDGWMLRYMWTKIKDEDGRFNF